MDLPPPSHWPGSVEIVEARAWIGHGAELSEVRAADGAPISTTSREPELLAPGGRWRLSAEGALSWAPTGMASVPIALPGPVTEMALQGEVLWVIARDGLRRVTPAGAEDARVPNARSVWVDGDRLAVFGPDGLSVLGADGAVRCQVEAPRPSETQASVALRGTDLVWMDGRQLWLYDAETCAPRAAAPASGALLGIADGRVWSRSLVGLTTWTLPDLRVEVRAASLSMGVVLSGPRGPVLYNGYALLDPVAGAWTNLPGASLVVRGPDRLVARERDQLVVRDATGAVIASHPAGNLGPLKHALGLDGDVVVSDGQTVLRVGSARQEHRFERDVLALHRAAGGSLVVVLKGEQVWTLAPAQPLRRISALSRLGLEVQGETRAAVVRLTHDDGRYALIDARDHTRVFDGDTLQVVGAPLPIVSAGAVSPDGAIAAGVVGDEVQVFEVATGVVLRRVRWRAADDGLDHKAPTSLRLTVDAGLVAVGEGGRWLLFPPEGDRLVELRKTDKTDRYEVVGGGPLGVGQAWPAWPAPSARPTPSAGGPWVDAAQVALALQAVNGLEAGDPLCTDPEAVEAWLAAGKVADAPRMAARLRADCEDRPLTPPEWPAATAEAPAASASPGAPISTLLTADGMDLVSLPLVMGRPTLVVVGAERAAALAARPPSSAVDLVVVLDSEPDWKLYGAVSELDEVGGRQAVMAFTRSARAVGVGGALPQATRGDLEDGALILVRRDGQTLRGDPAAVLEAAGWAGAELLGVDLPSRVARQRWTYQAPDELNPTVVVAEGRVLVSTDAATGALTLDGQLAWTRPGVFPAREGAGQALLVAADDLTARISPDGQELWRVPASPAGLADGWVGLGRRSAAARLEDGLIWVSSGVEGVSGSKEGATLRFSSPDHLCTYDLLADRALPCVARPMPEAPRFGDLTLRAADGRVTATRPDGEVAWTLPGEQVVVATRRRALVRVAGEDGPWVAVDARGRPRERLGLGDATVAEGLVFLTHGATISAWEVR